jgi:hypothetical protein
MQLAITCNRTGHKAYDMMPWGATAEAAVRLTFRAQALEVPAPMVGRLLAGEAVDTGVARIEPLPEVVYEVTIISQNAMGEELGRVPGRWYPAYARVTWEGQVPGDQPVFQFLHRAPVRDGHRLHTAGTLRVLFGQLVLGPRIRTQPAVRTARIRLSGGLYGDRRVEATLEDGTAVRLFDYFSDELRFSPDEFVGKTVAECRDLRHARDVAYLQS